MDDFHLVRGTFTFSSSLRSRPIWKVIGPVLTASATRIEEEQSQPNDITFRPETGAQNLQILLLTPSSLEPSQKQDLILRLRQFAASDPSSCVKKAIAFLLSEEAFVSANGKYSLDGLFALQVMLFESLATPLPVIPIADVPSFPSCVQEYMASLEDIPVTSPTLEESIALLAHATSAFPDSLCEQTTNILSDLFPSFRALSEAVRTPDGQRLLEDYLGRDTAGRIVRFWREDVSKH